MRHADGPESAYEAPPKNNAALAGITAFIGISALFIVAGYSEGSRLAQYERGRVLLEAATVRVAIESGLNERIGLERGVVPDSGTILERACVPGHPYLSFAIGTEADGRLLYGDPSVLDRDPVLLDIVLPGATWSLAAVPRGGWKTFRGLTAAVSAIGVAIAALAGAAIHGLLKTRAALKELAYHDQLTELPNRALFWDRLRIETYRADRDGTSVCVCMVDLDDFKSVNDDLGHEAGDRLLVEVAARISAAIRKNDTVARLGGDEFAVIASLAGPAGIEELRQRLHGCFLEPFDLGSVQRPSAASIGCALYPVDGPGMEAVLAEADRRMYRIKHAD